jgi:chemotaxis response regulator CheB
MPKEAIRQGGVEYIAHLEEIPNTILDVLASEE